MTLFLSIRQALTTKRERIGGLRKSTDTTYVLLAHSKGYNRIRVLIVFSSPLYGVATSTEIRAE